MNLLFDTPIFIWWLKDDKHLAKKAREWIAAGQEIYISSASIWEAGMKVQMGKLDADIDK